MPRAHRIINSPSRSRSPARARGALAVSTIFFPEGKARSRLPPTASLLLSLAAEESRPRGPRGMSRDGKTGAKWPRRRRGRGPERRGGGVGGGEVTHGEGYPLDGADGVAAVARIASSAQNLMAIHGRRLTQSILGGPLALAAGPPGQRRHAFPNPDLAATSSEASRSPRG